MLSEFILKNNLGGVCMSTFKRVTCRIVSLISSIVFTMCFVINFPVIAEGEEQNPKDLNAMAVEIVVLVNEARAEAGLRPVYMVPYLNDVAKVRARECVFSFSHTRPDGSSFITALDENLVPYYRAAENIAAGHSTAAETFEQWKNSPSHWAAIMNPNYTHLGVAVAFEENSTYRHYWQQLFVEVDEPLAGQYIPHEARSVPQSMGDLNGDAQVSVFDLVDLNKYLAGICELNDYQLENADMLKDGVITSADAAVLKGYLIGEYDTLPMTMEMMLAEDVQVE